jgi:hypothetical protein
MSYTRDNEFGHSPFDLPLLPSIIGGIFPAFAPVAILTWICSFFL